MQHTHPVLAFFLKIFYSLAPLKTEEFFMDQIQNPAGMNRDLGLAPEPIRKREDVARGVRNLQIAAVIVTVASILFSVAFFNIFTLLLAGSITYGCIEACWVLGNIKEMLSDPTIELGDEWPRSRLLTRMTEGAPLASFIVTRLIIQSGKH